jgi:hypothetical protein
MRRIVFGVLTFGALAVSGPGCDTVRPMLRPDPGMTGYAYCSGFAAQRFLFPPVLVERAAVEALADLKVNNVHKSMKSDGACLLGYLYDGRYIRLSIEPSQNVTIVSVNVDIYGDEPFSQIVLNRISVRLATTPQVVNPPYDPRNLTDSIQHRGQDVEGYRGAPLR